MKRREREGKREGGEESVKLHAAGGKGEGSRGVRERWKEKGLEDRHREMKNKMLCVMHLARRAVHVYAPRMRCALRVAPREKKPSRWKGKKRRFVGFYELSSPFDPCIILYLTK